MQNIISVIKSFLSQIINKKGFKVSFVILFLITIFVIAMMLGLLPTPTMCYQQAFDVYICYPIYFWPFWSHSGWELMFPSSHLGGEIKEFIMSI